MIVSAFIAALTVQILLTHTCNDEFQFESQLGSTCHLTTTPSPHSINSLALGVVRLLQFYKIFYPPTLTPSGRICGLCASLVPRFQLGGGAFRVTTWTIQLFPNYSLQISSRGITALLSRVVGMYTIPWPA